MNESIEVLRLQLQDAQRALQESELRCQQHDAEHQAATKELADNRSALLFMLEDLDNLHQKIQQSHLEWMAALDVLNDPIFLHDPQFRILRCNKAYQQVAGIPFKQIIGQPYFEVFPKLAAPLPSCLSAMEKVATEEEEIVVGDRTYRSRAVSVHDEQSAHWYSIHTLEDITERKKSIEALFESESRFRQLSNSLPQLIWTCQADGPCDYLSEQWVAYTGIPESEQLGYRWLEQLHPDDLDPTVAAWQVAATSGADFHVEFRIRRHDGVYRWFDTRAVQLRDKEGKTVKWFGSNTDITENKQAELALRESQKLTQDIIDGSPALIYSLDATGKFTLANKQLCSLLRVERDKLIGQGREIVLPKEVAEEHRANDLKVMNSRSLIEFDERNTQDDGEHIYLSQKFPLIDSNGEVRGVCGISTDITEREKGKLALQRTNRALRTLSEGNQTLIHATDELQLLQAMCRVAVEKGGYRMAWVGYAEQDEARSFRIMAQAGLDEDYFSKTHITWSDTEFGQGVSGRAVRSRKTQIAQDIELDSGMAPWKEDFRKRGFSSAIALPLLDVDLCFGVLTLYASERNAFDSNEVELLEEMAGDLAFGILTLRVRLEHREHELRLQENMLQTVKAISGIVEMRDPYTSGHQTRVAKLAQDIAQQMALPKAQVEAIHLAGLIHDLGKISVPAEILSRPGRLNELEFGMIKMHPKSGYDILKGIDFSLPIAQMVYQHHERIDGSGYPQGLKGEEILLGARILCVADVIEAMSSHRPYRPGLGIEAALDEIVRYRDVHFDAQVVDACMSLFKQQNYVLPS
ncbi:MAG: hypothetical protein FD121_794 [Gallionellaceae bacterium]|nr:MAG: hypothetical protein FD121_794 [Gallionellaceae bacterium]